MTEVQYDIVTESKINHTADGACVYSIGQETQKSGRINILYLNLLMNELNCFSSGTLTLLIGSSDLEKTPSLKWAVMCWVRRQTLLSHILLTVLLSWEAILQCVFSCYYLQLSNGCYQCVQHLTVGLWRVVCRLSTVTGRFAPSSVCPWKFRPQDVSLPWRIQRFLLIQLIPKHWRNAPPGGGGEMTKGRNVHKSCCRAGGDIAVLIFLCEWHGKQWLPLPTVYSRSQLEAGERTEFYCCRLVWGFFDAVWLLCGCFGVFSARCRLQCACKLVTLSVPKRSNISCEHWTVLTVSLLGSRHHSWGLIGLPSSGIIVDDLENLLEVIPTMKWTFNVSSRTLNRSHLNSDKCTLFLFFLFTVSVKP